MDVHFPDASAVLTRWYERCSADGVLAGKPLPMDEAFIDRYLHEIDVDYLPGDIIPPSLITSAISFADQLENAGTALRMLPHLPLAVEDVIDDLSAKETIVRAHRLAEIFMVLIASRALSSLDSAVYIDTLTRLGNRTAFDRDLAIKTQASERPIAMVFADVDGLKAVNDREGHGAGDALIKKFAESLATVCVPLGMQVYRWAGDEHAVLASGRDESYMHQAMADVRALFEEFSWGLAMSYTDEVAGEVLIKESDAAMYLQKEARKRERASGGSEAG